MLRTGMVLRSPLSVLCRHELTHEITGITRVTALLLSKQSDCAYVCACALPLSRSRWLSSLPPVVPGRRA